MIQQCTKFCVGGSHQTHENLNVWLGAIDKAIGYLVTFLLLSDSSNSCVNKLADLNKCDVKAYYYFLNKMKNFYIAKPSGVARVWAARGGP